MRTQSDDVLISLTRDGSEPAFEALATRYTPRLLRYCTRFVQGDAAQDVVQQTLMAAHQTILSGRELPNLSAWLYRTAHNRSIDVLRRIRASDELDERLTSGATTFEVVHDQEQFRDLLKRIDELPERQRAALLLRAFEGRSYEEIAESLDASIGSINQLLIRATRGLRKGMGVLLPLPFLRSLSVQGHADPITYSRMAEIVSASTTTGAPALKAAGLIVATGALAVGGGIVLDQQEHQPGSTRAGTPTHAAAAHPSLHAASLQRSPVAGKPRSHRRSVTTPDASVPDSNGSTTGGNESAPGDTSAPGTSNSGSKQDRPSSTHSSDDNHSTASQTAPVASKASIRSGFTHPIYGNQVDRPQLTIEQAAGEPSTNDYLVQVQGDRIVVTDRSGSGIAPGPDCTVGNGTNQISCPLNVPAGKVGVSIDGGSGDDRIENGASESNNNGQSWLWFLANGGAGNDELLGSPETDSLIGGPGNDLIRGRGGYADELGSDSDEEGNDRIIGGSSVDIILGGGGGDNLDGASGDDWMHGDDGDDVMAGGDGLDHVMGLAGRDKIDTRDGSYDRVWVCTHEDELSDDQIDERNGSCNSDS